MKTTTNNQSENGYKAFIHSYIYKNKLNGSATTDAAATRYVFLVNTDKTGRAANHYPTTIQSHVMHA